MDQWDADFCRMRYQALMQSQPELFGAPSTGGYRILTGDEDVRRAQSEASHFRAAQGLSTNDLRVGVLAEDPYLLVMREAVEFPDGSLGLYNRLSVPRSVVILPLIEEKVVLIHRFRHGTRRWHYELPRGIVERGDRLEDSVRRELREEVGGEVAEMRPLGALHTSSGVTDEYSDLFLARLTRIGEPDRHEAIAGIEIVATRKFRGMIADATITDGPTLAAYARAEAAGLLP